MVAACCAAHAQFAATYNFTTAITDTPTVTNVTLNSISATNTSISRVGTTPNFIASSTSWAASGASADTSEYVSVSLHANTSYELSLTSLSFKSSNSSTGPTSFSVALYVGNALQETSSTFTSSSTTSTTSSMPTFTFNFSDLTGVAATSLVEFRFYGWGGSSGAGALKFDDIAINGTVSAAAIPEPSTFALLGGLGALGLASFSRTRARRMKAS